jgi:all-trans-retinol dehydrogenase (NAD+)
MTDKKAELTYKVNVIALGYTIREFLPAMKKANHGHVITIASAAGTISVPGQIDYNASKFAAFAIDEGLRLELKKGGSDVKTTCISPGFVDTGMFEGAKVTFSLLTPILKCDWLCKRVVNAIRQDEKVVLVPYIFMLNHLLRSIVPVTAFDAIAKFFGALNGVEDMIDNRQITLD